jgi:hypothetical protein
MKNAMSEPLLKRARHLAREKDQKQKTEQLQALLFFKECD